MCPLPNKDGSPIFGVPRLFAEVPTSRLSCVEETLDRHALSILSKVVQDFLTLNLEPIIVNPEPCLSKCVLESHDAFKVVEGQ